MLMLLLRSNDFHGLFRNVLGLASVMVFNVDRLDRALDVSERDGL